MSEAPIEGEKAATLVLDEAAMVNLGLTEAQVKERAEKDERALQMLHAQAAEGEKQWRKKLENLQDRVGNYFRLVGKLGSRAARRKANVTPNDLKMWELVVARHRQQSAMSALKTLGAALPAPEQPAAAEVKPKEAKA